MDVSNIKAEIARIRRELARRILLHSDQRFLMGQLATLQTDLTALTARVAVLEALKVPISIYSASLTDTTTGTSAEDVRTVAIPAGTLGADGDSLVIEFGVKAAATANNKTVAVVFDGTTYETSTQASNGNSWFFTGIIRRVTATTLVYIGSLNYATMGAGTLHIYTGSATWANALNFIVRLTTPTVLGDATLHSLSIVKIPAAA